MIVVKSGTGKYPFEVGEGAEAKAGSRDPTSGTSPFFLCLLTSVPVLESVLATSSCGILLIGGTCS
jgi:hypothetical protein